MELKNQKSKSDILIEMLDKVLIEAGLEPTKPVNQTGSLVITSSTLCRKNKDIYNKQAKN